MPAWCAAKLTEIPGRFTRVVYPPTTTTIRTIPIKIQSRLWRCQNVAFLCGSRDGDGALRTLAMASSLVNGRDGLFATGWLRLRARAAIGCETGAWSLVAVVGLGAAVWAANLVMWPLRAIS